MYKKQVAELHQKLSDETKRADKLEFEGKKAQEKISALTREKEVSSKLTVFENFLTI